MHRVELNPGTKVTWTETVVEISDEGRRLVLSGEERAFVVVFNRYPRTDPRIGQLVGITGSVTSSDREG